MIQGFSEQTKPLTDYEDKVILPLIVQVNIKRLQIKRCVRL